MLLQEIKLIQNKNNLFILNKNIILQNFSRNRFFGFSLDISKHSQKILNWEHVTIIKSFLIGCYFIIPQKKKSLKHCKL